MSLFSEPMRWVTRVAAAILLANVRNQRLRVFSLDLKRGDECIFCVYSDVVRLAFKFKPDGKLHWRAYLFILWVCHRLAWSAASSLSQHFALALGGFLMLTVWKAPPWVVVALLAAAGALLGTVRYT